MQCRPFAVAATFKLRLDGFRGVARGVGRGEPQWLSFWSTAGRFFFSDSHRSFHGANLRFLLEAKVRPLRPCGSLKLQNEAAPSMQIKIDDLSRPEIHALLNEHLQGMYALSPPGSVHALDLEKLRCPEITFWSAWDGGILLGCGALKELDPKHGEIKSMRTPNTHRRRGAARAILAQIIATAALRSYERLSLETGSMAAFKPAQTIYQSVGFNYCGPFGDYTDDPNSVFMTRRL
jgi:putative acetyltransferase